jgi:hypothetical protein
MSVSVRTRFEVFKRDRFTCVYCGRHPPDVLLEADHVIPDAAGGPADMDNLVTACWDCNRGKSDRMLEEGSRPLSKQVVDDARERAEQAVAYAAAVSQMRLVEEEMAQTVAETWADRFGATLTEHEDGAYWVLPGYQRFPNAGSVRRVLRKLPLEVVLEAVDITSSRFSRANSDAERYFFGVCWRKADEAEGVPRRLKD